MGQDKFAILFEMTAVFDQAFVRSDNLLQERFSFDQWCSSQVVAIEVKQIEGIETETAAVIIAQRCLQSGKV